MPAAHVSTDLSAFLNGERRQVWALRRDTGEPFYLDEGQADAQREFTRSSLRCPHPDCDVLISTRGGEKRDHFWHPAGTTHAGGKESEFHLAAKAMLGHWAGQPGRLPEGATVREEHTVKDSATSVHRRADVMVTGRSGRQVAYEVEYKAFAVEDWRRKEADYQSQGIACLWLLGHTRVRLDTTGPEHLRRMRENAVRVPALAAAIAQSGVPLVVVNPATRQVGTLADDQSMTRRYQGRDTLAFLSVDALSDCRFDSRLGLVTPTLMRLRAAEEEVARQAEQEAQREAAAREKAAKAREKATEWARKRAAETEEQKARRAAARAEKAAWVAERRAEQAARWNDSDLRQAIIDRWGGIPSVMRDDRYLDSGSWGVYADPTHWRALICEHVVGEGGLSYSMRDVFWLLAGDGIQTGSQAAVARETVGPYLVELALAGLVRVERGEGGEITRVNSTGRTVDDVVAADRARALDNVEHARRQAEEQAGREKARQEAQWQAEREERESRQARWVAREKKRIAWRSSALREAAVMRYGDPLPPAIIWPGGDFKDAFNANPEHWRAVLYMNLVDGPQDEFRLSDALELLRDEGIAAETPEEALEGVWEFLVNMGQRGLLSRPGEGEKIQDPTYRVLAR